MASIIDSFKGVFSDRFSLLKLIVITIPVYYSCILYTSAKGDYSGFYWIAGITLFLLLGFLIELINNVINDQMTVLPSLNPIKLVFAAVKGLIAIVPVVLISCWLANYLCSFIHIPWEWVDTTLRAIIWLVFSSVIITSILMFSVKERILDAYRFGILLTKAGDLVLVIVFFAIQIILINLPTTGFIWYLLNVLFGAGPVVDFFIVFAIVFNVAVTGHYLAQAHYDLAA